MGLAQSTFMAGPTTARIQADQSGKTLTIEGATWVNKGAVSAISGGILTVEGIWSNSSPGTISENASTLNLGGTITGIPMPTRTGGTINLTGTDDLGGGTLALTATTGSWNIQGGTIKNGTLSLAERGAVQCCLLGDFRQDQLRQQPDRHRRNHVPLSRLHAGHGRHADDERLHALPLRSTRCRRRSLSGTGSVVLNGTSGGSFYLYNGYGHMPTISSGIKVHGYGTVYFYGGTNSGTIQADQNGKTLTIEGATWVNKGTLSAISGGILTVEGTWSNSSPGAISENASTLNLAGTVTGIPMPTRTGGTINLTGVYDLGGKTLSLTATTGSLKQQGGTIKKGTISLAGGAQLNIVSSGIFDKINLANNLTDSTGTLYLYHACTLATGVVLTMSSTTLYLYDQPDAGASLSGTGQIVLNGTSGGSVYFYNGYGHARASPRELKYMDTEPSTSTAEQTKPRSPLTKAERS